MNNNPIVTVAIPCYKKKYLDKAISSILAQTYKNFELIIVDDASPQDIKAIVKSFNDPRIFYYRNDKNIGKTNPANNWNKCLELANGEYFALLCDDDIYAPTFLEEMLALANKYPECSTFRTRANIINAEGKEINRYASAPEWESWDDYLWHVTRNYRTQTISEWLFKTDALRKAGGYALLPLAWYADYLSIFRISKYGGIASTSHILMSFRQSGENISSKDDTNTIIKIEAAMQYRHEMEKMLTTHKDKDILLGGLDWLLRLHLKYNLEHAPRKTIIELYFKRKRYKLHFKQLWRAFWHKV